MTKPIDREDFMTSEYLKLDVIDFEKKLIHRTRFIIEVCLDKEKYIVKKLHSEIQALSQNLVKKHGFTDLTLDHINIRTKKRLQSNQKFIMKLNVIIKNVERSNQHLRNDIRNQIYNFLTTQGKEEQLQDESKIIQQQAEQKVKKKMDSSPKRIVQQIRAQIKDMLKVESPNPLNNDIEDEKRERKSSAQYMLNFKKMKMLPIQECWVKIDKKWEFYSIVLKQNIMVLSLGSVHKYVYLKGAKMQMELEPYCRIEISHICDHDRIEIRVSEFEEENENISSQDKQFYEVYLMIYTCFKESCTAVNSKIIFEFEVVGKIKFELANCKFFKDKEKDVEYLIRLTHEQISLSSNYYAKVRDYYSQFYLPIINPYGSVKIQILRKTQNWFRKNLIGELICCEQIQIQQIFNYIHSQVPNFYQLTMSKYKQKNEDKEQEMEEEICSSILKFEDVSSYKSYFKTNQKYSYEGELVEMEYSRDEMRMNMNRIKRILFAVTKNIQEFKDDIFFKRPVRALIIYCLLFITFILFDWNHLPSYVVMTVIFVTLFNNKNVRDICYEIIVLLKWQTQYKAFLQSLHMVNPDYRQPRVISKKEAEMKKFEERFELKMRKERNLYGKYKRLQEVLFLIQYNSMVTSGLIQKFKNLLIWNHYMKTKVFLLLMIVLWVVLRYFPIRLILVVGLVLQIKKAKNYYSTVYFHNSLVIYEIFKITANCEQKQFLEFKAYLIDPKKRFDTFKHYFPSFQKRFVQNIENLLDLRISKELLLEFQSIEEVQDVLSTYHKKLRINHKYRKQMNLYETNQSWFTDGPGIQMLIRKIYSYLYNIPSDRYLIENKANYKLKCVA